MLVVKKFGGTSVGSLERIENVAARVAKDLKAGQKIVVVVSAMSGETNKLLSYAEHFSSMPPARETDMLLSSGELVTAALLAIALNQMQIPSIALSGKDAGIVTDNSFGKARIEYIDKRKILDQIDAGRVVVVAGFQGVTQAGDVTTLGRGGSDLSAVAIAGAVGADLCEIYTDVDGVYTTDPRIEPKAKKLEKISYEEMLELASLGAKVLQNRSVELAKKARVRLITRSSFNDNPGTLITNEEDIMEKPIVSGIAADKNQARITLRGVADKPGIASSIFNALAKENINVDMIVQSTGKDGKANIGFTVPKTELELTKKALSGFSADLENSEYDDDIVKISIVGVGMKSSSGVASKMFSTLAENNINILMIATSEIKVSVIILEKYTELAVRSLHDTYHLDS